MLHRFFIDFCMQRNMAAVPKVPYVLHFWHFFDFLLLCCLDDLLIDFWLIFDRFWGRKSTKNRSKIDQKNDQKSDAILDGFWTALGSILERFLGQVGGQVGAQIDAKSLQSGVRKKSRKQVGIGNYQTLKF